MAGVNGILYHHGCLNPHYAPRFYCEDNDFFEHVLFFCQWIEQTQNALGGLAYQIEDYRLAPTLPQKYSVYLLDDDFPSDFESFVASAQNLVFDLSLLYHLRFGVGVTYQMIVGFLVASVASVGTVASVASVASVATAAFGASAEIAASVEVVGDLAHFAAHSFAACISCVGHLDYVGKAYYHHHSVPGNCHSD